MSRSQSLAILWIATLSLSVASAQQRPRARIHISREAAAGMMMKVVLPEDLGIPGDVALELLVSKQGKVHSVRSLSGDKRLQRITTKKVMQWRFMPFYLNGETVEFVTQVSVRFDGKKGQAQLVPANAWGNLPLKLPDVSPPNH